MEPLRLFGHGHSVDKIVQVAVQILVKLIKGDAYSVIGDPVLGEIIRANSLGPVTCAYLAPSLRRDLLVFPLKFGVV